MDKELHSDGPAKNSVAFLAAGRHLSYIDRDVGAVLLVGKSL